MARFQVEAGGKRFEVEASTAEEAAAAATTAATPETWGGYLTGLGREAVQGATFDWADDFGLTDAAASREFAARNPIAAAVAKLAGGVVPFIAGPGAAAAGWAIRGGSLAGTAGRMAAVGTGAGGIAGAGAAEDNRLAGAVTGAAVGGALGGLVPPALAAAAAGGRAVGGVINALTPQRARSVLAGGGTEPPLPFSAGPRQPPVEGATFLSADGAPPVPPPAVETANAQQRALQLMADQLMRAGRSVDDVNRELAAGATARRFHASGRAQDVTALADIEPAWQRLAGSVWRQFPEGATDINAFLTARQTGMTPAGADARALAARGLPTRERFAQPMTGAQAERELGSAFSTPAGGTVPTGHLERVRDALRRAFLIKDAEYHGHAGSGVRTVEQIVQRAEQQAEGAYAKAFAAASGLNLRRTVGDIFSRHISRARAFDDTATVDYLDKARQLFMKNRAGLPLNLQQVDAAKRSIDGWLKRDLAKPEYVHRGGALDALRRDLLAAVDTATGGPKSPYAAARAQFSDSMSMADAYLLGRKALEDTSRLRRTGPGQQVGGVEVTADTFNALTPGQKKLFRLGLLDAVTGPAMRKARAREALAIFDQPRVQALLGAVIPRTSRRSGAFADRPQRFGRFVEAERLTLQTRDVVRGNSMTARNLSDDEALAAMEAFQQVQNLTDIFRGSTSLGHFGMRVIERVIDRSFGLQADTGAELARLLFTANPSERTRVLQQLAAIMPASRMARFNELIREVQRATTAPGAAAAGSAAGAPMPDSGSSGPFNL